ncbi:hypothetical protein R50073_03930 [Maricurvus nonylphenolicus]|uniref:TonB-dependent receptor plug domain-containing protein n=1 Tax=Maricurvus nonylphenolicus TaxID=1008307 RepID=UPI0036F33718
MGLFLHYRVSKSFPKPAVACFLALCVGSVIESVAAEQASSDTELAEMSLQELLAVDVFTAANLLPTQTSKAPGTVYQFTEKDFKRFGVRRLDDLLQFVPGMQVNQYRKRHRTIWARGLLDRYNDKLLLLVDGVRQQHLYYGHFALGDNFPLERIEKVEVIMGPASSLYGANAFGGIISVTTKAFSDQPRLDISMELGDNQRRKVSALYNRDNVQAFGSYLEQDAPFRDDRKSFIGNDVLQPLDEDYQSISIKARPIEGLTLKADYSKSETPFLFIPPTQDAFVEEEFLSLSAHFTSGDLDSGKYELLAYYQDDDGREFEKEQVTQSLGYEEFQDATMMGISLTGFKKINSHTLALGTSWNREEADHTNFQRWFSFSSGFLTPPVTGDLLREPDISNDNYAVFVQDVWEINPVLTATLGARYDQFDQFDNYGNYRGALVYSSDIKHTWKLLYGTAIRTPSFREYLKVLEGTSFQAPVPDAESIESLEFSYIYKDAVKSINVTVFKNNFDDFIREVPTPDNADEYFANSSATLRLQGAEVLLGIQPVERVHLRLSASYVDSDSRELGSLPYIANWTGSFKAEYEITASHRLGLSVIYNSHKDDNNGIDDDAENFAITNLYGSGEISPSLSYRFGIDNLFDDKEFDPAADFGGQHNTERSEREVWVGLTWTPSF